MDTDTETTKKFGDMATKPAGKLSIDLREPLSFSWSDVDRIYQIANSELWKIRREADL
jgi:hypothetical protein